MKHLMWNICGPCRIYPKPRTPLLPTVETYYTSGYGYIQKHYIPIHNSTSLLLLTEENIYTGTYYLQEITVFPHSKGHFMFLCTHVCKGPQGYTSRKIHHAHTLYGHPHAAQNLSLHGLSELRAAQLCMHQTSKLDACFIQFFFLSGGRHHVF